MSGEYLNKNQLQRHTQRKHSLCVKHHSVRSTLCNAMSTEFIISRKFVEKLFNSVYLSINIEYAYFLSHSLFTANRISRTGSPTRDYFVDYLLHEFKENCLPSQ